MAENNNNDIIEKLLIAGIAFAGGVAVGMLFSPKSGKENRAWVRSQANKLGETATQFGKRAEEKFTKVVDKMAKNPGSQPMDYPDESSIYEEDKGKS